VKNTPNAPAKPGTRLPPTAQSSANGRSTPEMRGTQEHFFCDTANLRIAPRPEQRISTRDVYARAVRNFSKRAGFQECLHENKNTNVNLSRPRRLHGPCLAGRNPGRRFQAAGRSERGSEELGRDALRLTSPRRHLDRRCIGQTPWH